MERQEGEKPVKKGKNRKKILLIVLTAVVGVLLVLAVLVAVLEKRVTDNDPAQDEIDYAFYPVDFEENIYEDPAYIEKTAGEFIRYTDLSTNITTGLDRERAAEYDEEIRFFLNYLYAIIEGDADAYNAMFSRLYFESNAPKAAFTMQKVYDVLLCKSEVSTVSDESGNYTKYVFTLEYKILCNNGSFRRDIGAGSKLQYITLTDREGALRIDSIVGVKFAVK